MQYFKERKKLLRYLLTANLLILLGLFLSFCGRKKREDNAISPNPSYLAAPSDLKIDTFIVPDNQDFAKGPAHFSAKFNHKTTWYLTLRGTNGAVKTFTGLSDGFDNLAWTGNHDSIFFFRADSITAELSFLGTDYRESKKFRLLRAKVYSGLVLFNGFNTQKLTAGPSVPKTGGAFPFTESGEAPPSAGADGVTSSKHVIEGSNSYHMAGRDANNTYFIEGIRVVASYQKQPPSPYYLSTGFPSLNPDSLYFNVFVYGTGNTTTRGSISVQEDDNKDGVYTDGTVPSEDSWEYDFEIDWQGWKLVSARYSDFSLSKDPKYGGSGNGVRQLDRVKQITFNLLSDLPGNMADYYLDYPILTSGESFDPHQ